ncbi:uncharacterized protein ACB058_005908 isoform 1-T2 [Synchiropus picturatus]
MDSRMAKEQRKKQRLEGQMWMSLFMERRWFFPDWNLYSGEVPSLPGIVEHLYPQRSSPQDQPSAYEPCLSPTDVISSGSEEDETLKKQSGWKDVKREGWKEFEEVVGSE